MRTASLTIGVLTALSCAPAVAQEYELAQLPQMFVENAGQWDGTVRFASRKGPMTSWFVDDGWVLTLTQPTPSAAVPVTAKAERQPRPAAAEQRLETAAIRMRFVGGKAQEVTGSDRHSGAHDWFLGNDRREWVRGARGFGALRYHEVYPGIDVVIGKERSGAPGGAFGYDLHVAPGADLSRVRLVCEGTTGMHVAEDGSLILQTALGPIVQQPAVSWSTDRNGRRTPVSVRYVAAGERSFGFRTEAEYRRQPLTIDPGLVWSSYLGGSRTENPFGVHTDAEGVVTVAGWTRSPDFPRKSGKLKGKVDCYVSRFDPSLPPASQLLFTALLGGSNFDEILGMKVDRNGVLVLTGSTASTDFPVTANAYQRSYAGGSTDAFVMRFDPSREQQQPILYSSFLGGNSEDTAWDLDLASNGAIVTLAGRTSSSNAPLKNALQPRYGGGAYDGFVTRIDFRKSGNAGLVSSTYLGGSGDDRAVGVATNARLFTAVVGVTTSTDFPLKNAHQNTNNGATDAFATLLTPIGSSSVYSTYLGGSGSDGAWAVHLDDTLRTTFTGDAQLGFPVTRGAWQTAFGGGPGDAFLTRLSALGSLDYSTYIGGPGTGGVDSASDLVVDAVSSVATICGIAGPGLSGTPGAVQSVHRGGFDAFTARIKMDSRLPRSQQLPYFTYLGGTNTDWAHVLELDPAGVVTLVGGTWSTDLPGRHLGFQNQHGGKFDSWVARFAITGGYASIGRGCGNPAARLQPDPARLPRRGRPLGLLLSSAPAKQPGILFFASKRQDPPVDLSGIGMAGCKLHVLPILFGLPLVSDASGNAAIVLPLPNDAVLHGVGLMNQGLVVSPGANAAGLILTNGGAGIIG